MSMRMYMNEITLPEKEILGRQYNNSPFGKQPRKNVTTLDIFDFDSTLFLSPMLSCNIWHSSFINTITTENLIGPGWWRDIRSLPQDNYESYWNEDVVDKVKTSSNDSTHLTVLLTGRRYHPFHQLIQSMLASKGLVFDLIGLRPDPEQLNEKNELGFNYEPNVFDTTMEFKTSFIVHMLATVPTLKEIIMWDDRISHISIFQTYLSKLQSAQLIQHGELVCIKPGRPKYNPTWEKKIVQDMIHTHNQGILALEKRGETLERVVTIENYDGEMISSTDLFELKSVPSVPSLTLQETTSQQLKSLFKPLYKKELLSIPIRDWEHTCAEEPMYFGNQILLSSSPPEEDNREYQFRIKHRTQSNLEFGMILQVELLHNGEYAILPLWYKPSMFATLLKKKDYQWIPVREDHVYLAKTGHHHLLNVTKSI